MPRIKGVELAKGIEPNIRKDYIIETVELTKSPRQNYGGYRVQMRLLDADGEIDKTHIDDEGELIEYSTMLWESNVVGRTSKLGSFLVAFQNHLKSLEKAKDTDNWIGEKVTFLSWAENARELRVIS